LGKAAGRDGRHDQYDGEKRANRTGWSAAADLAAKSYSRLDDKAKKAGSERREMNKEQPSGGGGRGLRRDPQAREASRPDGRPRTGRRFWSDAQPASSGIDSAETVHPTADARRPNRCAIAYKELDRRGEFHVVVTETGGSYRSVARSPAFCAPRAGALRRRGAIRVAHELLVRRLEARGWLPLDSGGAWYELGFVRVRTPDMRMMRSLVTLARGTGQARFVAEELDTYGNPTPLMLSAPFGAPRFLPVRASRRSRAALQQLLRRMESEGWKVAAAVGKHWYTISLWRPVSAEWEPRAPTSRPGRGRA
jgi:hypothetical protein